MGKLSSFRCRLPLSWFGALLATLVFLSAPQPTWAQTASKHDVKVTVVDQNGDPVVGAVVVIKGTTSGKTTDEKGVAILNVAEDTELEVRFAGLKPQTINVRALKEVAIEMEPDAVVADEVVAIGYGTAKKVNLSGSVAVAPTEMLENRSTTNVLSSLQGTVANLNITSSTGAIDAIPSINLRGMTSIGSNANTNPLILIDGVPADNEEFARLNPNDIKSISVLKDPSTAAIYGSRAAFGAILVTTKEGSGAIKVDYSSNYAFRRLGRLPEVVTDPVAVMEYANVFAAGWYNLYSTEQIEHAKNVRDDPENYPAQYVDDDGNFQNLGQTDWFDEVYDNLGFQTTQNLTLSGSAKDNKGKTVRYLLSGQYMNMNGMLRKGNDYFNQYNIRSKVDYEVTPWLRIGNNTSYMDFDYNEATTVANHGNGTFFHNVNRTRSLSTVYNVDGSYTSDGASLLGRLENGGRQEQHTQRLRTLFTAQATIFKDIWTISADAAFSKYNYREREWDAPVFYSTGPNKGQTQYSYPSNSYAYVYDSYSQSTTYNIYTNYAQTFNEKHTLSATVGFNQESYYSDGIWAQRNDLITTSLPSIDLATAEVPSVGQGISDWATRGLFARVGYIYDNKYIFEANARYDGTSRFPSDDRFVFNPSGSLAWVISEEGFFEKAKKTVNLLKLRASYGTVGNQNVGTYEYIATMGSGKTGSILDGVQPTYVSAPGLVSSSLTWEQVRTLDLGLEANFFNNRLQLSGGWFRSWTEGMLTKGQTLPSVIGTGVPRENAADLRTSGWEVNLSWKDQFMLGRHPFRYDATFTMGDYRTIVTKYDNPTGILSDYYVGYEIGELWGYVCDGFFQSEEEILHHADQTPILTYPGTRGQGVGDIKFRDLDNDGEISTGAGTLADPGDQKIIGNSRPRYNYSFTIGAEWAGIDLRVYFQGVGKRDYYPSTGNHYFWGMYAQPWANLMVDNLDHWTEDNRDAYFPAPKSYAAELGGKELGATNTRYMQDASYLRLKNLTIGYTFPNRWMEKVGLRNVRVYFTGENLITWTKLHKSLDPEGLDGLVYPHQKTYSFGLNFSF